MVPRPLDDFDLETKMAGGDLALALRMMRVEARTRLVFKDPASRCQARDDLSALQSPGRFATTCDRPGLPRALMFRDSFATVLVPLLSEHFASIPYVVGSFDEIIVREVLADGPIDVVIEEVVERDIR